MSLISCKRSKKALSLSSNTFSKPERLVAKSAKAHKPSGISAATIRAKLFPNPRGNDMILSMMSLSAGVTGLPKNTGISPAYSPPPLDTGIASSESNKAPSSALRACNPE